MPSPLADIQDNILLTLSELVLQINCQKVLYYYYPIFVARGTVLLFFHTISLLARAMHQIGLETRRRVATFKELH